MALAQEEWHLHLECRHLDAALLLCKRHWAAVDYLFLGTPAKNDFLFNFLKTLKLP